MDQNIEIITDRLILRRPRLSDLAEFHAAKTAVWRDLQMWMSWAYDDQASLQATEHFIRHLAHTAALGFCRDTGKFVVATGLRELAPDEYETGYWVAKDFLGRGYATEATNAVIRYGFDALHAKTIHISYMEGNAKSKRIIDKLGFVYAETRVKSHVCCLDGTMMDEHRFVMHDTSLLPHIQAEWRVI